MRPPWLLCGPRLDISSHSVLMPGGASESCTSPISSSADQIPSLSHTTTLAEVPAGTTPRLQQ